MNYKQIIADSWKFTQDNRRLIYWFGFLPSFLTTSVGIGYLAYQFFAFKKSFLFDNSETSFMHDVFGYAWDFFNNHSSLGVPFIIISIIVGILWFLVPTLFKACAVQAIARARNGQPSGVGVGLKHGIMSFLPLLEFHAIIKTFAPFSIIIEMAFVLRNLGITIFNMLLPVFIVILIVSLIFVLLFTYSDLFIIIDDEDILSSMKKSTKLVILSWQQTFLITILMIIIGIRIVIQAIFVFLIPAVVILGAAFIATLTVKTLFIFILGFLSLIGLLIAAYLGGIVDIFSYTVWTYTFLELTSQKEISARDTCADLSVQLSGGTDINAK